MQAVKDKINEMGALRKVKAEARAEERAEKEIAKARSDVAHEVRLAKEAEASMSLHVAKAGDIARAGEKFAHDHQMVAHAPQNTTNTAHQARSSDKTSGGPPTYNPMS
ncbi:hypothetical protein GBA52_007959 [Prunus armeniaca]|nr:hypothetical protein GBA52_007959 [Prunus armeniaca]